MSSDKTDAAKTAQTTAAKTPTRDEFRLGELPPGLAIVRYAGMSEPASHALIGNELRRGHVYCVPAVLAAHLVDQITTEFVPFRDEDHAAIEKARADVIRFREDNK